VTPAIEQRHLPGAETLELLSCVNGSGGVRPALLFVHGAYVGAWCWAEHFLAWFAERGFACHALSLRGHGRSGGRERLHQFGIGDYVDDLQRAADEIGPPPVLIGHSMGALVVQKYLERAPARAAVHVCPVPPFGLLPSTFALAFGRPAFFSEINALAEGHSASRTALAQALFSGAVDEERIDRYYARMQAESRRALMDMTWWGLPQLWRMERVDALVIGASEDALISPALARSAATLLGAEYRQLEGLGHAVMLETAWEQAAQAILDWLGERSL
jgi:pimeloyl-ACP methyl ester carboxylesterase